MNVKTPNGESKQLNEILDGLKEDDIVISEPNKETISFLSKYYTSNVSRKIMANRYKDISNVEKYFNTKLHDIVSKEFVEEQLPDVVKSSEVINKHIEKGSKILLVSDYDVD
jgi:16S rRNA C1402 (ribose-2'-O) methylase RsmI